VILIGATTNVVLMGRSASPAAAEAAKEL